MPTRELTDTDGQRWEIFEVRRSFAGRSVSSALNEGWLAFQSGDTKRRLPNYPADWAQLPEAQLWALFAQASRISVASGRTAIAASLLVRDTQAPSDTPAVDIEDPASSNPVRLEGSREDTVRAFARQARANGETVVQAAVKLKRFLADAGQDMGRAARKRDREWFIESFYLERYEEGRKAPESS